MKTLSIVMGVLAVMAVAACSPPDSLMPAQLNYDDAGNWLCLPGKTGDVCQTDLSATEIRADGSQVAAPHVPATDPQIDCFYVYPTVDLSILPGNHTDFKDLKPMSDVAINQAARFSEVCRVYAPLYRQMTIGGYLLQPKANRDQLLENAFADVRAAFTSFLSRVGSSRKFVLIGHSQGGQMVDMLLQRMFVEDPALRSRLVVAMPIGANIAAHQMVPAGQETAVKQNIPLCQNATQRGCSISYGSWFAGGSPTITPEAGTSAECVNPVSPGSNASVVITRTFLPKTGVSGIPSQPVSTQSALYRGFYAAKCVTAGPGRALEISEIKVAGDKRSPIPFVAGSNLHVDDVNLALGDLIDRVR